MYQLYNQTRSKLRGNERRIVEYVIASTALFVVGLVVIYAYVDQAGLDARAARGATSGTMFLLGFIAMIAIWRVRQVALARSLGRWSVQRMLMAVIPHGLYLTLVSVMGVSYFSAQLGIALIWGLFFAFPLNFKLCDTWTMKETDEA